MKKPAVAILALLCAASWAQTYVAPHVRRDGTFVQGHIRSSPDSNPYNNYSTQGNTNPYTGQTGNVNPYSMPSIAPAPTYSPPPVYQQRCGVNRQGVFVCL